MKKGYDLAKIIVLTTVLAVLLGTAAYGKLPPPFDPPINCPQWTTDAASVTFDEGNGYFGGSLSGITKLCSEARWGADYAQHGYMHSTDHLAALRCILKREPTYLEVYDSWSAGESAICQARQSGCFGDPTPFDLLSCLTLNLCVANGSRLYNEIVACKKPVPAVCAQWPAPSCGNVPPPVIPPPPPTPNVCPTGKSCKPDAACVTQPLPARLLEILRDADTKWALMSVYGPGKKARIHEARGLAEAYRPCVDSTGRLEMVLEDVVTP